uniref:Inosine-uridine preferring nucleoside hydrolase family protein n=1 Tax=Trepomonas sp. PC1 TaxID=1076344 RepID=A0A146KCS2_9EUKA|eukprot:JAP94563.1 Inosine-uridine preferring nucleoside hydrolase family protein [Trepomonas sp. PC1]
MKQHTRLPIWLDCDPGHDDMMAIIMASVSPAVELKGISTTHGNQTVEKTYQNARRTTVLTGIQVPVYKGYSEPLIRQSKACPEIHGESGLGGVEWYKIDEMLPHDEQNTIQQFFDHLEKEITTYYEKTDKKFTIISTGAFTNIAMFVKAKGLADKIKLVSMAGNFKCIGNIMPWSEFNVLIDPEAGQYLLNQNVHITFIPLDVTHTVLFTEQIEKRILQIENKKFGVFICALLNFFKETYDKVFQFKYPPLHDPVAVFFVLFPEAFITEDVGMRIECQGEHTYGACCADWFGQLKWEKNSTVCLKVDVDKFWDHMIKCLEVCKGL